MGFLDVLDKIKGITQPYNDDEELLDELQENDIPVVETVRSASAQSASQPRERRQSGASRYRDFGGGYSEPRNTTSSAPARNPVREQEKVVNLHTAERPRMEFVKLGKFDLNNESASIIDKLRDNRTILLNLEEADQEKTAPLIYLLSGAAYALDGRIKTIGSATYAVIPHGVDYSGDSRSETVDSGLDYDGFSF